MLKLISEVLLTFKLVLKTFNLSSLKCAPEPCFGMICFVSTQITLSSLNFLLLDNVEVSNELIMSISLASLKEWLL